MDRFPTAVSPLSTSPVKEPSGDSGSRDGVLLIGHGTRQANGTDQFFQLADQLQHVMGKVPVAACLLEFQEPTIAQAWASLVDQGVTRIWAAPLLLFAAGHAKQDIPTILAECQRDSPEIVCQMARPLSRQRQLIALVLQRIHARLASGGSTFESTALVMVGRGSYDPCAQADMRVLSTVIGSRLRIDQVETAFYAMAEPRLPTVLDSVASSVLARDSDRPQVLVQPHLLFDGRLYRSIQQQIEEAADRHPEVTFVLGDYLGPDRLVAEAIAARVRDAIQVS
ncbi:MAG: sirohydrochlorin chelatase [Planctomycetota bacterium]